MQLNTTTWRIHNIKKHTKRDVLVRVIKEELGNENFSLSFKDNNRLGTLITVQDTLPQILFRNSPLDIRKQKNEERPVKDIVTPLNAMTYSEQLEKKTKLVADAFMSLGDIEVETIKSPVETGYRNKCEFTFGFTNESKEALGFRPSKFASAPNLVASPIECTFNTPSEMLSLVASVNTYLSERSGLVYNRITKEGFLRLLCLRRLGNNFISILQVNCETFEKALENPLICDFIKILPEDVFLACSTGIFDGILRTTELQQVSGTHKEYTEVLNGCVFEVFPLGFFQINRGVAELLAKTLQENIQTETILDTCCGSGTLGICAAKDTTKKVIGLELSEESIKDAERNAKRNNINANYYCGSVEKTLPCVLAKIKENATALIDPPRAGISDKLVNSIIAQKNISEIFYVSCSYSSVTNNIQNISKVYSLKKIYVLDMFPFTNDVECIFHFVRKENINAILPE